jgi:hypothetical protein
MKKSSIAVSGAIFLLDELCRPQPGHRLVLNKAWKCPVLSLGGCRETARVYCVNRGRSDRVAARNPRAAADFAGDWIYEQQVAQ